MRTQTRRINRFAQMLRFFSVSRLLLWTLWVIYRERQRVLRARERGDYEVQPNIEVLINVLTAFRDTALKLGVLMIKLGQFLSTRADLLPERALAVLASLQDEVPAEPFERVVTVIEEAYAKPLSELFSDFEHKSAAAASLGQVHKAVLAATGTTVAVKVQRPAIKQLVTMDLSSLRFVIWIITRFVDTGAFDLWGFYREFRRTVYEEIDFTAEAANAQRFREIFKDDPTIYIPKIYDQYVTSHVLVMEWIDGIKLNDYPAIDAAGYDRTEAANRTVRAYFYQFVQIGFFHADPHPGNIFIKSDSQPDNPVIAFLDFGMVGSVTNNERNSFRKIFLSVLTRDAHAMVAELDRLGFIGTGANMAAIEKAVSILIDQYYNISLGQMRELDPHGVMQDVVNLLYGQPFTIPARYAFVGRAIGTLVGVSTGLAPDFNFIEVAIPYARTFFGLDSNNPRETIEQVLKQVIDTGQLLIKLPRTLDHLINQIESGQIEIKLANQPTVMRNGRRSRRMRGRGSASASMTAGAGGGSISLFFVFIASLGGGVYLNVAHLMAPGWFCLGLAAITALGLLFRR
jgi:Predicted unusual protein kinase